MITLLDISFWLYFIYFFFAVFIAFFIPGDLLIKRLNLPSFSRITVSTLLGLVISVWLNGVLTLKGLYFCCGSIMDNILHLSITNQIAKNFPPFEPGMYGVNIQNYHYWGSLVIGELVRIFKLPLLATSYQYMTVFISLFLGISAVAFAGILKLKRAFTRFLFFFLY